MINKNISSKEHIMYLPDGSKTTDTEEFIKVYSEKYFTDYPKNCKEKEDEIIQITQKGRGIEPTDVITLMRWKTNCNNTDGDIVNCFGKRISTDIGEKVVKAINSDMGQDYMDIYNGLLSLGLSGMGTVYLLTLVWAISGMKYPIYDKFAKIAITAICESNITDKAKYKYPPDKNQKNGIKEMYEEYQTQLTEVFKADWKTRREIDQALWVYGHKEFDM